MMVVSNLKKKLSIIALTCSALLALTNPVNADEYKVGDVFYCDSEAGAFIEDISNYDLKILTPRKFRFKIENKNLVKFGKVSWLLETEFKIDFLPSSPSYDMLVADNMYGYLYMSKGRFNLTQSTFVGAYMMTGTCDKF